MVHTPGVTYTEQDESRSVRMGRWLASIIVCTRRRAAIVVVACVCLGIAGFWLGKGIHLDTDLKALLPKTAPSVVALDQVRARKGSTDLFTVAVESSDDAANARMTTVVAEALTSWPEVEEVFVDKDFTPLRDHALYYLELADLQQLREVLRAERQRAVAKQLELGIGDGEAELSQVIVGDDWDAEPNDVPVPSLGGDVARETGSSPDNPPEPRQQLRPWLREQRSKLSVDGRLSKEDIDLIWPHEDSHGELQWTARVGKTFRAPNGRVHAVQAHLVKPATDIAFATAMSHKMQELLASVEPSNFASDMRVAVVGSYEVSRDVSTILADLNRATYVAATSVLLLLVVGFYSARGVLLVVVPLAVAVLLTLAFANAVFHELNSLTAFLFAVLFGMGVDFSVHLIAVRERQGATADWNDVLVSHVRPLWGAMITTVASLWILSFAQFKSFREFGIISGVGVLLCFVFALVMVPTLDTVLGPWSRWRPALRWPPTRFSSVSSHAGSFARLSRFMRVVRIASMMAVGGVAVAGVPDVEFEHDLRRLRAPESEARMKYGSALGKKRTATPVVLIADSKEDLDEAIARLTSEKTTILHSEGDRAPRPWVKDVVSTSTLLPLDQTAKAALLVEIAADAEAFLAELPDLPKSSTAHQYASHLGFLQHLAKQDPLRADELPEWALSPFTENNGHVDRIGHVFLDIDEWNVLQVVETFDRITEILSGTGVLAASSTFVFADLAKALEADTWRVPPFALATIFVLIAFDLRRARPTLTCFGTLALGLAGTLGAMGLWSLRINFYNLVVLPAVIGLGIDASLHLWHTRMKPHAGATQKGALLAAVTTVAGFSGLLAAEHPGLRSIGELGILATFTCVLTAFLVLAGHSGGRVGSVGSTPK